MRQQPTPEMEAENAAYVWVRECLNEHAKECRIAGDYLSDSQWEEIAWTFERLKTAFHRHKELETARLSQKGPHDGR